ncbi:ribosome small subunit-dependent GTPase A [Steroidobacter agaridevorans]|uniref:ribosome small subunit-dependent GTPase A n=1 Tax=Steroidobacter agaridevorans TaxID=2695856 RepID=UPI0013211A6D|nr:ribosome small subunit-dependent GTPase A [Steroidobacter agaridevorans]GFE85131.1 putative ribosome biogenesis GTPase RsgA [Steroidobacter agaridevorans]
MSDAVETPARVTESFGRRVIVETSAGSRTSAELFGKRLTCVCGDEVMIRGPSQSSGDVAKVVSVAPRRSLFARTDSRGRTEPLAANLSLIIVIIAPNPEPDLYIADRYLAGAALAGISGALIVNKSELPGAEDPDFQARVNDYERAGYPVLRLSAKNEPTVAPVRELLINQSAMLVGQSGVGKSTLTNRLAPESERATRTLSDSTGEGRHTTVSTALFRLASGGELIDSPGVRDYAPPPVEDAMVQVGWPEILKLAPECRFNNCLHLREPGCAVLAALAENTLSARRYESYKRLLNIMRGLAPEYERRR